MPKNVWSITCLVTKTSAIAGIADEIRKREYGQLNFITYINLQTFLYETFFHAFMGIANKPTNKMLASQRGGSKKIWIQRCRKWLGPSSTQIKYI